MTATSPMPTSAPTGEPPPGGVTSPPAGPAFGLGSTLDVGLADGGASVADAIADALAVGVASAADAAGVSAAAAVGTGVAGTGAAGVIVGGGVGRGVGCTVGRGVAA